MTASLTLSLSGPLDQLRLVWQAGEALLETVSFEDDPEGTRYNILVSIQEMLTNVLRHGYGGSELPGPVEVRFAVDPQRFEVELRDRAPAFDPTRSEMVSVPNDRMPASDGGYGIMIVRTVMDDVGYEYADGWNCLTMTKFVRAPALSSNG